jgi:hypothetical protein
LADSIHHLSAERDAGNRRQATTTVMAARRDTKTETIANYRALAPRLRAT